MSALIDTNLTLVYKNMVGFKNIVTDTSGNSYLIGSLSVNSNFYVSSSSLLIGSTTINSYLNVSGNTILNSSLSLSSSLNVSGNTSINGPVSIYNNLNVTGNTTINNNLVISGTSILNGPTTYNSQLYVSGLANILNGIKVDNINSNILNINASTINIGNYNSKININGTATSIVSSELLIVDKLISINVNSSTLQGVDIGMLSGIQIMGISSSGFIRTSEDASRYQIQTPLLNAPTNYITVQDLNNNFIISGTSTLIGSSTINSLFNSGGLIINGQTTINNSLNISGSTVINNSSTLNNTLTISGYTNIGGGCSINNFLNISGLTNINNFASINSYLNISGLTNINGSVSVNSTLNVSGLTIINNSTSINSSLNISGSLIINGPISINSSLNVSSSTNIIGNGTINSNMMISNKSIFNNYTTINSSLNVSGSSTFNNGIAIQSTLGISGQIVAALPHYTYNIDAIYGGVPLWGFYRSGAIIKIRVDDPTAPPRIFFSSGSSINIRSTFTDPGAYALDSYNNTNLVYLTSIISTTNPSNLLSSNLLISGSTTIVSANSLLTVGSYTATYQAIDLNSNIGYNYRTLNVIDKIDAYNLQIKTAGFKMSTSNIIILNDWTFEIYLYITQYSPDFFTTIFDIRIPGGNQGSLNLNLNYNKLGGIGIFYAPTIQSVTLGTVPLNTWVHICWMQKQNIGYGFINGVPGSTPVNLYSTTPIYQLVMGVDSHDYSGNLCKFTGNISQPLITNYAKYNISGFTPSKDLTPTVIDSSIIFFLGNNFNTYGQLSIYPLTNINNNISLLTRD